MERTVIPRWVHATFVLLLSGRADAQARVFSITSVPPTGSNQVQAVPAGTSVDLLAGVTYSSTYVTSNTAFFGTVKSDATAKLVAYGLEVCDASTTSLLGAPLDGLTYPTQISQLVSKWGSSKYLTGGEFTLCMSIAATYSVIPVRVAVHGVVGSSHKIFCRFSNTVVCTARLPGYSLGPQTDARIALVAYTGGTCGTSAFVTPFASARSAVTSGSSTEEIHTLGIKTVAASLTSYKACYCPRYQAAAVASGEVCTEAVANFVQPIGSLIFISVATIDALTSAAVTVYPVVPFELQVLCGTGGCSTSTSPRVKIVDSAPFNARPYYDSTAGCRASLQSRLYVGPANCVSTATDCALLRSDTAPADGRRVQFSGIRIDSELKNGVRVAKNFDVCYCDADCQFQANWFMVGSVSVQPLVVDFTVGGAVASNPSVTQRGSIRIQGATDGSLRTTGTQSREMKLLSDDSESMTGADCAVMAQSADVSGHDCYTTTNCQVPVISTKSSLTYGNDEVGFASAGWKAVCFCNSECRMARNWFVVSRLVIAGPREDHVWTATENLPFSLSVDGFGLLGSNMVKIVPEGGDCATAAQPGHVVGPSGPANVRNGNTIASISDGFTAIVGGSGTVVEFSTAHELSQTGRIRLSGVSTGNSDTEGMLNREHAFTKIDETRIGVNVNFGPGEFPATNVGSAAWALSGTSVYENIVISRAGVYRVCWAEVGTFVVSAGTLTVVKPQWTTGSLTLSGPPGTSATAMDFSTGRFDIYLSASIVWFKVVFTATPFLNPLDLAGNSWTAGGYATSRATADPATCQAIIGSFRNSAGSIGLDSCFVHTDSTSGTAKLELHALLSVEEALKPIESYTLEMVSSYLNADDLSATERGPAEVWIMGRNDQEVVEIILLKP